MTNRTLSTTIQYQSPYQCSTTKKNNKKSWFTKCIVSVSLLINVLMVTPILLMTSKVSLLPDGLSVQVSHASIGTLLQSDVAQGILISSPAEHPPTGEDDIGRFGKSCLFVGGSWQCQDCGSRDDNNNNNNNKTSKKQNCKPLKRARYKCDKPMHPSPWDSPPRVSSSFDPKVVDKVQMRTIHRPQTQSSFYLKQPLCTIETCFDLSKCNSSILTMYTNAMTYKQNGTAPLISKSYTPTFSTSGPDLLAYAHNHSSLLKRVYLPDEACLRIVFPDTYATKEDMYNADHWYPHGRNNLLWDMGNFEMCAWTGDHVFQNFHYEYAAVASQSLNLPSTRIGYDQVLPLVRKWHRPLASANVDIHRPRRWLLSFRGDIQHKGIPYYSHRWLASEYWENATDIYVDAQCRKNHRTYKDYDTPGSMYHHIMMNSTFGFCPGNFVMNFQYHCLLAPSVLCSFLLLSSHASMKYYVLISFNLLFLPFFIVCCPGGAGVSSYRLGEYLSTGTIPVVVGDILAPYAPELDWSECWIVVSEARVADLPRILRELSPEEVRHRQARCWHLHGLIWGERYRPSKKGWVDDPRVTFTKGMEIWAVRIANAIESTRRIQQIVDPKHY